MDTVIFALIVILGWAGHIAKKGNEAWQRGEHLSFKGYLSVNPWATAVSIIGPILLFTIVAYTGELTSAPIIGAWTAASIGYFGDSFAEIIGSRSKAFMGAANGKP